MGILIISAFVLLISIEFLKYRHVCFIFTFYKNMPTINFAKWDPLIEFISIISLITTIGLIFIWYFVSDPLQISKPDHIKDIIRFEQLASNIEQISPEERAWASELAESYITYKLYYEKYKDSFLFGLYFNKWITTLDGYDNITPDRIIK